jgi:hypothetical protein
MDNPIGNKRIAVSMHEISNNRKEKMNKEKSVRSTKKKGKQC